MFMFAMCEEETCLWTKVCPDCRRIKHYQNIYSKARVLEVLDNVLSRTQDKQENKIKEEVKKEVEQIQSQYDLRPKIKKCQQ